MRIYSIKNKKYNIFVEFCESIFQEIDINLIIVESQMENSNLPPINLVEYNSLIIIPYGFNSFSLIEDFKLIDIIPKDGEFINTLNNSKIDVTPFKIFNINKFKSLIDYINIQSGKIEGSIFSYKIYKNVLTIITTIELFLLNKIELEAKFREIFKNIIGAYKELKELDQETKKIKEQLKIEYIFNGNPLPILLSQFDSNQIGKKEFWSKWEKLESLTKMFSEKVLKSTINKLSKFELLKEDEKNYIIEPRVLKLSKKYQKFGMKLLGN